MGTDSVVSREIDGAGFLDVSEVDESVWIVVKTISDLVDETRDDVIPKSHPVADGFPRALVQGIKMPRWNRTGDNK